MGEAKSQKMESPSETHPVEQDERKLYISQMRNFVLISLVCVYAALLSWGDRIYFNWEKLSLFGLGVVLFILFLILIVIRLANRKKHRCYPSSKFQKIYANPIIIFLVMLFCICTGLPIPGKVVSYIIIGVGGLSAIWVFCLFLFLITKKEKHLMKIVLKIEDAIWPLVWVAFEAGILGSYGNIQKTLSEKSANGVTLPTYFHHLADAFMILALIVMMVGLFISIPQGKTQRKGQIKGPS